MPTPSPPTPQPTPAPTPKQETTYKNQGAGKCLQNGRDPAYELMAGKTIEECQSLCDGKQLCSGYSWSNQSGCLLWLPTLVGGGQECWLPTLAGGGQEWGSCSCLTKQDKSYVNLGAGKCLDNGKEPKNEFLGGKTEAECKQTCDDGNTCGGYSWSISMNCWLWQQPTLTSGGEAWGGASCFMKDG